MSKIPQSAVLPYRLRKGRVRILLITNRSGRRWIIPKGLIDEGETAVESGAREAYEEAGIRGKPDPKALGTYTYRKWGGVCEVAVYAMRVDEVLEVWPEADFRKRSWVKPSEAAKLLKNKDLQTWVLALSGQMEKEASS